ncbi:hypothetical protein SAMN05216215_108612 [Saccharopolyspora shandongensis]|uniref:Uncharacterized protein n=1 Tax=Saccharopolyspora shandongensis TaxID=418495 RepID=A0A1H3TLI6_9PSEU|nr:hypothetical protein SAMN05216215_108612 [Saccharopolyspora shandongensis]
MRPTPAHPEPVVELVTFPAEQPAGLVVVEIREHGMIVGDAD